MNGESSDAQSNGELLGRYARHGDEEAFARLVQRFGQIVHTVARHLLSSSDDADDVTQIVFAELARRAETINDPAAVGGWLHAVTVRVSLRLRERGDNAVRLVDEPVDPSPDSEAIARRTALHVLFEELDALPSPWREGDIVNCRVLKRCDQAACSCWSSPLMKVRPSMMWTIWS